jgi:hypothetical protein
MPSIAHLVAIVFVQLLAICAGFIHILVIGGMAPAIATETLFALEAAASSSFLFVLPLLVLHIIGSIIIMLLSFCSLLYLMALGGGGDDPPSGGGCPILLVRNGNEFVSEGLLNIHAYEDFVRYHRIHNTPEPIGKRFLLRLVEHPQTISHIDQVRLLGRDTCGRIHELPLVSAVHSEDCDVKAELKSSDDVRVDTLGANHNGGVSEFIDLEFTAPPGLEIVELFFVIEGYNAITKV